MARFIPDIDAQQIEYDSERLVYEALKGLDAEYTVLHSFPWLRPDRNLKNEPLREGEADFVIIHPRRGLLVIEVKGGSPELRNRVWFRGSNEMRNPFEQARRNMHALLKEVEEKSNNSLKRSAFSYGYAVVFPHCIYEGDLPLDADPRIFLDSSSLSDFPTKIEQSWAAWESEPKPELNYAQFLVLKDFLLPKLRLMKHIGLEISEENKKIIQITTDQQTTLQGLLIKDRVLVEGVAGSGKTLLAIDFAITLCKSGKRVLFLCYNKELSSWLQEQIEQENKRNGRIGNLEISTFHALAIKAASKANVEFEIPSHNSKHFWDNDAPLILEQALEILKANGNDFVFDAVIVDEAQDFAADWWVTVESLTKNGKDGALYVFADPNQSLRGEAALPAINFQTEFYLKTNCRNTRSIAITGSNLSNSEVNIFRGSPVGESPVLLKAASKNSVVGIAQEEIRKLMKFGVKPEQIALIGPNGFEKSPFRNFDGKDKELKFVKSATEWRRGDGILVTTSRSFKGLEADVIIIYDLENYSPLFNKVDLYVAWTRARHRLILIAYDSEIRQIVEKSIKQLEVLPSRLFKVQQ